MRRLVGGLSIVAFAWGCGSSTVPATPTAPSMVAAYHAGFIPPVDIRVEQPPDGNWLPWYFREWQPGLGDPLALDATVDAAVQHDDVCVQNLRQVWDARSSCKRFTLTVSSDGRLDVYLHWDVSAPGYNPALSGEVVVVAPDGHFASSDWTHSDEHAWVLLRPGEYGVLVMTYVPASLPFQIKTEFRPQ